MLNFRLLSATVLIVASINAYSSSFVTTSNAISDSLGSTSNGISKLSSSLRDNKIVLAARDDAASFVASEGEMRGVRLESALELIRREAPEMVIESDAQLARAILAI
jgi:uncharacterized protein (TIGR02448 family)